MSQYIPCLIAEQQIYCGFNHWGFFQIQTPTVLNIFVSFIFIFSYF